MSDTYLNEAQFESQQEQLKGYIRGEKIKQLDNKLKVERIKTEVTAVQVYVETEHLNQVKLQLKDAETVTEIESTKLMMTTDRLETIRSERKIRAEIQTGYLDGLRVELASTLAQVEYRRNLLLENNAGGTGK